MSFLEFVRAAFASNSYLILCVGAAIFVAVLAIKSWANHQPETFTFATVSLLIIAVSFAVHLWALPRCPACGFVKKHEVCVACRAVENLPPTCPVCGELGEEPYCGFCGANRN